MKYLLLMYADEAIGSNWSKEEFQAAAKSWNDFRKELSAAGVLISSSGVAPDSSVTTIRVRNDKTMITDGPFAETHEQLGGYFLVEGKDLDEAIRWAEKIPTAKYGSIEIRPLWYTGCLSFRLDDRCGKCLKDLPRISRPRAGSVDQPVWGFRPGRGFFTGCPG
jgi:hypothetical protein